MASAHPLVLALVLLLATGLSGCHEKVTLTPETRDALPSLLTRSGWTWQDGLNLSVWAEPARFAAGEGTVVRHEVVNEGDRTVHWQEQGCGAAWQRRVEDAEGMEVSWRASRSDCEEDVVGSELGPGERLEAMFHWDGKDHATTPPTDAAPGQYRILVTFRYTQGEGAWRLLSADALVAVR